MFAFIVVSLDVFHDSPRPNCDISITAKAGETPHTTTNNRRGSDAWGAERLMKKMGGSSNRVFEEGHLYHQLILDPPFGNFVPLRIASSLCDSQQFTAMTSAIAAA
jgi:hypothetical protein